MVRQYNPLVLSALNMIEISLQCDVTDGKPLPDEFHQYLKGRLQELFDAGVNWGVSG